MAEDDRRHLPNISILKHTTEECDDIEMPMVLIWENNVSSNSNGWWRKLCVARNTFTPHCWKIEEPFTKSIYPFHLSFKYMYFVLYRKRSPKSWAKNNLARKTEQTRTRCFIYTTYAKMLNMTYIIRQCHQRFVYGQWYLNKGKEGVRRPWV